MGGGSFLDDLVNALAGRGYIDGSSWLQRPQVTPDGPPMPEQRSAPASHPQRHSPAAPRPAEKQAYAGWSPINQQPGLPADRFHPANLGTIVDPNVMTTGPGINRQIAGSAGVQPQGFHPADLRYVVDPNVMTTGPGINRQMAGSAPALGQRFQPFSSGFGLPPSLVDLLLASRRG